MNDSYQHNAREAREKIAPKIYNSRWYAIRKLKDCVIDVRDRFLDNAHDKVLLDYGCGSKPYKDIIGTRVKQYIAADLDINPSRDLTINIDGTLPLEDQSVDIVISTQVLEHVENPVLYLNEAYRVLKKDGLLILSTHGMWLFHPDPMDYWRWTSMGLKKIHADAGFHTLSFEGMMGRSSIGLQLFQDGFIFKLPKVLLYPFCVIMQLLIALADKTTTRATRNTDAGNYMVVSRK